MAGRAQINHLRGAKYRLLPEFPPTVESASAGAGFLSEIRKSMPSTRVPSCRSKSAPAPVHSTSHRKDADNHDTSEWHENLYDPTLAGAICDWIIYNAYTIQIDAESMRNHKGIPGTAAVCTMFAAAVHHLPETAAPLMRCRCTIVRGLAALLERRMQESGLDPYRYLLWVLHIAPKLTQQDSVWAEKMTPALAPAICKVPE